MKTCWKTLPSFRQVGDSLMKKYYRARPVTSSSSSPGPRGIEARRKMRKTHLVLKKGKLPIKKVPKKSELVFLQMSPNYCERDLTAGSLGTVGRSCNRTSRGEVYRVHCSFIYLKGCRNRWLRFNVLWTGLQHASILEDLAM